MTARIATITGPAFAASYLINNDASGLEDAERASVDAWLNRVGINRHAFATCTDPRFSTYFDIHFPEGRCSGGDVVDYTYFE